MLAAEVCTRDYVYVCSGYLSLPRPGIITRTHSVHYPLNPTTILGTERKRESSIYMTEMIWSTQNCCNLCPDPNRLREKLKNLNKIKSCVVR